MQVEYLFIYKKEIGRAFSSSPFTITRARNSSTRAAGSGQFEIAARRNQTLTLYARRDL
jgi:hypothetical protein